MGQWYLHAYDWFASDKQEAPKKFTELPLVTQLVRDRAQILIQVLWLQDLYDLYAMFSMLCSTQGQEEDSNKQTLQPEP